MVMEQSLRPHYIWGVFPAIGMAGIVTLLFINLPRWWRLLTGIALWVIYQWLMVHYKLDDINFAEVHSGFWGGVGYGIMMLLATVVCEAFENHRMRDFLIAGAVFTVAGIITAHYWGFSKNRLTGPYIFISLGLACFVFYVIWYLYDYRQITQSASRFFAPIGKNPFFLYILHGIISIIPLIFLQENAMWVWPTLCGLANIVLIWLVAVWMDRKRIYISI
jgi:predicted acyltransferase